MLIKTIHKAMILSLVSLAVTQLNASAAKPEAKPVTLRGVLQSNAQGKLECEVTYNPAAGGSYTGKIFNKNFSMAEWADMTLDQNDAQKYYNQLQAAQLKATSNAKAKK